MEEMHKTEARVRILITSNHMKGKSFLQYILSHLNSLIINTGHQKNRFGYVLSSSCFGYVLQENCEDI